MPRCLHTHGQYPPNWPAIANAVKLQAHGRCIRCGHPDDLPSGHVLTVHHMDGDKANCVWWNLLALCQRCHLRFQGRVNPFTPYFLEHSAWFKLYAAGFYAFKYECQQITRAEAEDRLDQLLAYERKA
jgi:5-methylcytosine-specific restriction endonuclease McrA